MVCHDTGTRTKPRINQVQNRSLRCYKDGDDFKYSSSFGIADIPIALRVLQLAHGSRGAVRLVAYLLRRTLGWLDKNGEPIEQDVAVSFSELVDAAGISRGAIRPAIDEAIDAGFVTCTRPGHKGAAGKITSVFRLLTLPSPVLLI